MFIVTNKWLNQHRTANGGWTNAQWYTLGLTSSELRAAGWKKKIIGKAITEQQKLDFELAKNEYSHKTRVSKRKAKSELNRLIVTKIRLAHHRRLLELSNHDHKAAQVLLDDILETYLQNLESAQLISFT